MSEQVDWTKYRMARFESALQSIQPEFAAIEAKLMDDIEICEVNVLFQRFKDFTSQIERIRRIDHG